MKLHIKFTIVWLLVIFYAKPIIAQSGAHIVVHTNSLRDSLAVGAILGDKVFTGYGRDDDFGKGFIVPTKIYSKVDHGTLTIEFKDLNEVRYVSFYYMLSPIDRRTLNAVGLYDHMYLSPGDSVEIWENHGQITYEGRSAAKFSAFNAVNELRRAQWVSTSLLMDSMALPVNRITSIYHQLDSFALLELSVIRKQPNLSNRDKEILECEAICRNHVNKRSFWTFRGGDRTGDINKVYEYYSDPLWSEEAIVKLLRSEWSAHNALFLQRLLATYYYDSCYRKGKTLDIAGTYAFYSKYATNDILEWLTYSLVKDNLNSDGGTGSIKHCIDDALANGIVHHKKAKEDFEKWRQTNVAGVKAFDFEVIDTKGKIKHLSDYKGSVLLLDFWFIGCGNCVNIQPALDTVLSKLKGKKFLLMSICLDDRATKTDWLREVKRGVYTKADHVNLFASTKETNGRAIKETLGIDYAPLLILIDKDGNIAAKPTAPNWGLKPEFLLKTINQFL